MAPTAEQLSQVADEVVDLQEITAEIERPDGRQNHWVAITLRPDQIAAGVGTLGDATFDSDGPFTLTHLFASERGTGSVDAFLDFEVSLEIAGFPCSNRPVSARAWSNTWWGRRFVDILEGRPLAITRGESLKATFRNLSAGSAIDPALHLLGYRGFPKDWREGSVLLTRPSVRPYAYVVRNDADGTVADGATLAAQERFNQCFSFSRLALAEAQTLTTGDVLDFDVTYEINGQVATKGVDATATKRRLSMRALGLDFESLDLRELLGGMPQVMDVNDVIDVTFHNNSGSTLQPRLVYFGHMGKPFGDWQEQKLERRLRALLEQAKQ